MRAWLIPVVLLVTAACSDKGNGPGTVLDAPSDLTSTSLDRAVALSWRDNAFQADPGNFRDYRVYSTSYDIDASPPRCGTTWQLEGTTVAPEFLVGALANGVPRCFSVTAESVDGGESNRSPLRNDTPRPDTRNVLVYTFQSRSDSSGFRFWDDDGDLVVQDSELGVVRSGSDTDVDFFVDRDPSGDVFLKPERVGTGVEFYADTLVEDLTSIDFAAAQTYHTTPIQAVPGMGYVFEMREPDGFPRYGALRVTHVGQTFILFDWAFQTDPGNPELMVSKR
jgi:hypothetical protein